MRFVFRVDASAEMGVGHLMRCLALARALRGRGAECIFLCRAAGLGSLAQDIQSQGHLLLLLPEGQEQSPTADAPAHARWLPGGWQSDAQACREALQGIAKADWLIVDHYALDHCWELAMRPLAGRLMVIDDLADRPHDCDLLLDQSLVGAMSSRYDGLVPARCFRLLGPRYAMLRQEFEGAYLDDKAIASAEKARVLVMFGGADAANLTLRAVQSLIRLQWPGRVEVVAGPLYAHLAALRAEMTALSDGVLHAPASNIVELMRAADFALGSPGVTSWERCACGLPALTIAQADNQEPIAEALAEAGAHWYLGRAERVTDGMLDASLKMWLGNSWGRALLRRSARQVCDGKGLRRIIRHLYPSTLVIRKATAEDAERLFAWRNDERTRRYSIDARPLDWSAHEAWMARVVERDDVLLLLACSGNEPKACVRFDVEGVRARVSIYTAPDNQGKGVGSAALNAALDWLKAARPEVVTTVAEVLAVNAASHALFTDAGYRAAVTRYELVQGR